MVRPWPGAASVEEVNAWQSEIARIIRETEAGLPNQHLIAGQEAFAYAVPDDSQRAGPDVYQFADTSFDAMDFDLVNMHPLSNMVLRDKRYNVGQFMMAQLRLKNLRQYCLGLSSEKKPFNLDEDNCRHTVQGFQRLDHPPQARLDHAFLWRSLRHDRLLDHQLLPPLARPNPSAVCAHG